MYLCETKAPQAPAQANSNKKASKFKQRKRKSKHAKASKHIQAQTGASKHIQHNVRAAVGRYIWLELDALKQLSAMATSRVPRWKAKAYLWMDQEEMTVTSAKVFLFTTLSFYTKTKRW